MLLLGAVDWSEGSSMEHANGMGIEVGRCCGAVNGVKGPEYREYETNGGICERNQSIF